MIGFYYWDGSDDLGLISYRVLRDWHGWLNSCVYMENGHVYMGDGYVYVGNSYVNLEDAYGRCSRPFTLFC